MCIEFDVMELISTKEAAEKLGVTVLRVQQLIWGGRLPAQKIGRDYVIQDADLALVADRKPGRPPKATAATKHIGRKAAKK
jgi:excisionase family DNA binding protein